MTKLKRALIMAGGTGGHVYPGLAVALGLREQAIEVHWLGTRQGLEAHVVPAANIPLHFISIQGLRGKGWRALLRAPWRFTVALVQAIHCIRTIRPDVVIGMGGFVSGPGGVASFLLGKKLIIHEQNAKPGLTNQWLAVLARKVLEGFPNTFTQSRKVVTTGNPVRKEIAALASPSTRSLSSGPLHLLVVGGSLGAQAINQLLPQALATLPAAERPIVWHQTGEKHYLETLNAYTALGVNARIVPFITAMDQAYSWADMVLCRAGALTIAELCAAGLGAILVPYPHAVDDHQTANANFMVRKQAALVVQQAQLTKEMLASLLYDFYVSAEKRLQMATAAYQLRRVDATESILNICKEVCR